MVITTLNADNDDEDNRKTVTKTNLITNAIKNTTASHQFFVPYSLLSVTKLMPRRSPNQLSTHPTRALLRDHAVTSARACPCVTQQTNRGPDRLSAIRQLAVSPYGTDIRRGLSKRFSWGEQVWAGDSTSTHTSHAHAHTYKAIAMSTLLKAAIINNARAHGPHVTCPGLPHVSTFPETPNAMPPYPPHTGYSPINVPRPAIVSYAHAHSKASITPTSRPPAPRAPLRPHQLTISSRPRAILSSHDSSEYNHSITPSRTKVSITPKKKNSRPHFSKTLSRPRAALTQDFRARFTRNKELAPHAHFPIPRKLLSTTPLRPHILKAPPPFEAARHVTLTRGPPSASLVGSARVPGAR
ncbi:putative uncharacterized protein ENSP00000383309 [Penaeus indicus]|uniref:putative uncharacterized protein ENSP00000383309 n=1 Tax=Penaeus indicus TaxID=29960 RepID=UPI00300CCE4E